MKRSYLDYAMSVIIGRPIPDIKDASSRPPALPVLHVTNGTTYNKPYKKSAAYVGDVIGKYPPPPRPTRPPMNDRPDGPGVSACGPSWSTARATSGVSTATAAAMRYTEVRMSKLARR